MFRSCRGIAPWTVRAASPPPACCPCWPSSCVVAAGCTRGFFRERADRDVENLLTEKSIDPRWAVENWYVYPDERARFVDTDNPDRPEEAARRPGRRRPLPEPAADPQPILPGHGPGGGRLPRIPRTLRQAQPHRSGPRTAAAARPATPGRPLGDPTKPAGVSRSPADARPTCRSKSIDAVLRTERTAVPPHARPGPRTEPVQQPRLPGPPRRPVPDRPAGHARSGSVRAPSSSLGATAVRGPGSACQRRPGDHRVIGTRHDWGGQPALPDRGRLVGRFANQLVADLGSGNGPTVSLSNLTLELDPAASSRRRLGGDARTADPGRAQPGLRRAVLRPVPEDLLRLHRRRRRPVQLAVLVRRAQPARRRPEPERPVAGLPADPPDGRPGAERTGEHPQPLPVPRTVPRVPGEGGLLRTPGRAGRTADCSAGQRACLQRRQELQNGLDGFKLQLGVPTRLPLELDDGADQADPRQPRRVHPGPGRVQRARRPTSSAPIPYPVQALPDRPRPIPSMSAPELSRNLSSSRRTRSERRRSRPTSRPVGPVEGHDAPS